MIVQRGWSEWRARVGWLPVVMGFLHAACFVLGCLSASRACGGAQTLRWETPMPDGLLRIGQGYPLKATASSGLEVQFRVLRGPGRIEGGLLTATAVGVIEVIAEQSGDTVTDPVSESRRFNLSSFEYRSVQLALSGLPIADVIIEGDLVIAACHGEGVVIFDISDRDHPVEVSRIDTPGMAVAVRMERGLLLVADHFTIEAYDIREPSRPRWLSRHQPPVPFVDRLALSGGIALIGGSGYTDFEFVDYTDPMAPVGFGGHRGLVSHVSRVEASGGNFAVSDGTTTVYFGVTNRLQISTNGASSWHRPMLGLSILGEVAAVAAGDGSILMLQLSLTDYPVELGRARLEPQLPLPLRELDGIALSRRWLLAFEEQSMTVFGFRVDDPARPELVGQLRGLSTWDQVRDARFHADGETLVVTLHHSAHLLRLREGVVQHLTFDPPASVPTTQVRLPLTAQAGSGNEVAFEVVSGPGRIVGNELQITGRGDIEVRAFQGGDAQFLSATEVRRIVVADPPMIVRQPDPWQGRTGDLVRLSATVSQGPPVTYAWYRNGQLVPRATGNVLGFTLDAARVGLYAVVASNVAGVVTSRWVSVGSEAGLAVQQKGSLRDVGSSEPYDGPVGMASRGRHLWTAAGTGGALRVFDLENPEAPVEVGRLGGAPGVRSSAIVLADDIALIAKGRSGIGIVDVSSPATPVLLSTLSLPGESWDLVLEGRHLYVAAGTAGVHVLDVSEPRKPVVMGQWAQPFDARGVAVDRRRLAVVEEGGALSIVDFQKVDRPALLSRSAPPAGARGTSVLVRNGIAFVSDLQLGVRAFEHSEPESLRETRRMGGRSWRAQWVGDRIYSADESGGFQVLGVADPLRPTAIGSWSESIPGRGLRVDGNRLVVLGRDLHLFELEPLGMVPLLTGQPELRRALIGSRVRLDATAAGTGPFRYRWFRNGVEFSGAQGPWLEFAAITTGDAGEYSVEISGMAGSVVSVVARLEVTGGVGIVPGSLEAEAGGGIRFRIEGALGRRVIVLGSKDLRDWTEAMIVELEAPSVEIRLQEVDGSHRFYRLQAP
jgi:hypothetical protein